MHDDVMISLVNWCFEGVVALQEYLLGLAKTAGYDALFFGHSGGGRASMKASATMIGT